MKHQRWSRLLRPTLAGAAFLLMATACVGYIEPTGSAVVWVDLGPPPPRHEYRSESPGIEFIWIGGENQWNGSSYDWQPGRWERRPQPGARYHQGKWHHGSRGWQHEEGHWDNGNRGNHGNRGDRGNGN